MKLPIVEGGLPILDSISFSDGMRKFKMMLMLASMQARLVILDSMTPIEVDLPEVPAACDDYHLQESQDFPEPRIREPRERGTQQDRPEQLEYG